MVKVRLPSMQKTNMSKTELSNGTNTSDFLKSWAKGTLRSFHWRDFNESLYLKSPRELGNDDEKEKIYALSSETKIADFNSKIDYFISHSWEDKRALKCSAISSFVSDSKVGYCSRPSPIIHSGSTRFLHRIASHRPEES